LQIYKNFISFFKIPNKFIILYFFYNITIGELTNLVGIAYLGLKFFLLYKFLIMTLIIIIITSIVSVIAFNNKHLFTKFSFSPYFVKSNKEWYRFFTYGLLHSNWIHLIVNMFVFYSFGNAVEQYFKFIFKNNANLYFILLYAGGIIFSVIYDYKKHRNDIYYSAVGASGAVSSIVFSSIFLYPTGEIYIFLIPFGIPSVVFGIIYLVYSAYMSKRASDNIGHNAHFLGAIFGLLFTIALKPNLVLVFLNQIKNYFF